MIDSLFAHKAIVLIINLVGLWLSALVYRQKIKEKTNKIFVLMFVLMFFWVNFAYLARMFGQEQVRLSELCLRIAWFVTPLFFVSLYLFVIALFQKEQEYRGQTQLVLLLGTASSFITGFTNLIIEGITFVDGSLAIIYGKGMIPFLGIVSFLIYTTLYPLFKNYFSSSTTIKRKVQYFLIGIFIFYVGNIVFNIALPLFFNVVRFYYLGDYSAIFLLGFVAYAILKRELFGIKLVLTSLLVALIAILLLLDAIVFTPQLWLQIVKGFIFVIFLYFGYLLIQSVMREIHYRERLQRMNKELKKLDRAKSEFISIASHQLRTPLGIVKGYVSMLSEGTYGNLPLKSQKPIRNVYRANERLIKLVNDLLSLSRIESGKIEIKLNKASLQKIISNLVEDLKTQAHNKNIYLRFDKPKTSLSNILIDQAKIKEVISNIIDNAIKYTAKGGVTVTLRKQKLGKQEKAIIEIKDTGLGMTKREISKIFQSFSRGTAGVKLYTGGAGLGLYIAKKFANMHGGDIKAISEGKSKGSTFYIELPIK